MKLKWDDIYRDKQRLILHRCTRALHEELNREEIVAMVSIMALESRITPDVLRHVLATTGVDGDTHYVNTTALYRIILGKINERCGFNAVQKVAQVLEEEEVDMEPEDMLLELVMRVSA
jgi:hypothetical protein